MSSFLYLNFNKWLPYKYTQHMYPKKTFCQYMYISIAYIKIRALNDTKISKAAQKVMRK